MQEGKASRDAPLFSTARFDEDSIIIYPLFIAITAVMYLSGFGYFAVIPALVLAMIFAVEASERIRAESLQPTQLVGSKCTVMKQVSYGQRGVVKIIDRGGGAQWELWSAECNSLLEEGSTACVKGIRGMFLQIEPL
jgi:membrane protein implicated in regulation of membrane protease activity